MNFICLFRCQIHRVVGKFWVIFFSQPANPYFKGTLC